MYLYYYIQFTLRIVNTFVPSKQNEVIFIQCGNKVRGKKLIRLYMNRLKLNDFNE